MGNIGAIAFARQDDRAGTRDRPLGGGGTLSSIFQRGPVLPFGGAEMGRGHGGGPLAEPAVQHHRGQSQALCHGGTGPVKPEKRHALSANGEGRGDTLIEKVPGKIKSRVEAACLALSKAFWSASFCMALSAFSQLDSPKVSSWLIRSKEARRGPSPSFCPPRWRGRRWRAGRQRQPSAFPAFLSSCSSALISVSSWP